MKMKKETKDKITEEVRFFLFQEKDPCHRVLGSTWIVMIMLCAFWPTVIWVGLSGMIILANFTLAGVFVFYALILLTVLEGFHYVCDRAPQKVGKIERRDFRPTRSGREEAESSVAH